MQSDFIMDYDISQGEFVVDYDVTTKNQTLNAIARSLSMRNAKYGSQVGYDQVRVDEAKYRPGCL